MIELFVVTTNAFGEDTYAGSHTLVLKMLILWALCAVYVQTNIF